MSDTDTLGGTAAGWAAFLDEGEAILWQGRPDGAFRVSGVNKGLVFFGVAFAGFAAIWMGLASLAGGFFWMFGLLHFAVGVAIAGGALVVPPFVRRRTWYTLTDRRAFIAKDLPFRGRTLKSYPIDAESKITQRKGRGGAVYFATEVTRSAKGRRTTRRVGFQHLDDPAEVFALLEGVKARLEPTGGEG